MIRVERCPLCGGDGKHFDLERFIDNTKLHEDQEWLDAFDADKCQTCNTIYQSTRMDDDELHEYYSSGKYRDEHPSVKRWDDERAERVNQLVERFGMNPKSCLDVGCGRGELLKHLEVYFFAKILGLEYDPEIAEIEEVVHRKEDVKDSFDLITCIHVMEHMADPVKELEWMISKLNPGGTIILEMPTYLSRDLSHLFVPSKKGIELMLGDLDYLYIDDGKICNVIIGEGYSKYKVDKVYYTYESPDFGNAKELAVWLKNSYGKEMK